MQSQSRLSRLALSILAALFIAGCSSTATEPVDQQKPVEQAPEVVAPEVVEVVSDFAEDDTTPVDESGQPISRTFYFEYDKAILNPSDLATLEVHAQILVRNSDRSVVVQGHCDERGTREYNLALGERRAAAISSFLRSAGVGSRQIEVVSYGEERPQNPAHNSGAWAENRRAVLEYR
jgi:peptidoglycan-associated lipoprotein